jgi:DNA-binding MarR family transcriptional regulator
MKQQESQIDLSKYKAAAETCPFSNFRKASRVVTQLFDQVLEPIGLRCTQLLILLEIAAARSTTVPQLSRRLVIDASTLTRNLKLLSNRGWIKRESDKRRRSHMITLTPQGLEVLENALPAWYGTRNSFISQIGESRWRDFLSTLSVAVNLARETTPL